MQLTLFKALQSLKLDADTATEVVEAFEEHITMKVTDANAKLEAQLKAQTWMLGTITVMLAIIGLSVGFIGLAPVYLKVFGH